jgi:hypothetical protein
VGKEIGLVVGRALKIEGAKRQTGKEPAIGSASQNHKDKEASERQPHACKTRKDGHAANEFLREPWAKAMPKPSQLRQYWLQLRKVPKVTLGNDANRLAFADQLFRLAMLRAFFMTS